MSIRALLSRADGSDTDVDLAERTPPRPREDELLWVDAQSTDPDERKIITAALHLTENSAAVFEAIPSAPRAIVHADAVEVVGLAPTEDPDEDPVPLQVLVGDGWVITNHEGEIPFLDEHRESIQDQREVGRLTSVEFLVSLLDWWVDAFFHVAERLEREVDELDDAALRAEGNLLDRLVAMRRRIARVRRTIVAHRGVAAELSRPDFNAGTGASGRGRAGGRRESSRARG